MATRTRAPNFTTEEQLLLFSAMEPYSKIIECKKTDSTKQIDKQNAWSKVTQAYNSNTKGVERTTDNLISCYRNVKSKLKKQQSEAKMLLEDPNKKEVLLNALEKNGKDWDVISSSINIPADVCKRSFVELQKVVKKDDALYKKNVLGTGGGPPPSQSDPFLQIKKFIEPQMDGMYTIYDGDTKLMKQFQLTKPIEEQTQPIELQLLEFNKEVNPSSSNNAGLSQEQVLETPSSCAGINHGQSQEQNLETPSSCAGINYGLSQDQVLETPSLWAGINHDDGIKLSVQTPSRTDFLRKKRAPELDNENLSNKRRKNVNDNFYNLSQEKRELVQLQKQMLEIEMKHKMDLYELELQDKINENKFRAELRQKELHLIDLKIKKESQ